MMTGRARAPATAQAEEDVQPPEIDTEADYKSAFEIFAPLDGSITASQFRQVMADLGESVTDAEVEEVMNNVDGDEKISCEKSLSSPAALPPMSFPLLQLWKMKEIDADVGVGCLQTGSLSILRRVDSRVVMMMA